jgi:ferritin
MELTGTKTEGMLKKSFGAELQASFRYKMIAEAARRENLSQVADIFEATAQNEVDTHGQSPWHLVNQAPLVWAYIHPRASPWNSALRVIRARPP